MPSETIITQLKVLGHQAYVSAMSAAASRTESLDTATSRLGRTARTTGGIVDTVGQKVLRYSRDLGAVAVVTAGAGVAIGLKFDATMERAEIGMGTLLKNAELAKKTTVAVRDFALKAPLFGVEQMMTSAQQLIGAGYDVKKIVPLLTTFSDTLSAMGRKPEDLQRMTYAFVQMMSKGQISAEELRGQLGEIFPAQKLLARGMGKSSLQLSKDMKEGALKGKKPLLTLIHEMEKEYDNGTAKMAETFDGMWANIKEQSKFTLGTLMQPLFESLKADVFPAIQTFSSELVDVLDSKHMTDEAKWNRIKQLAEYHFGPIADTMMEKIKKADIPGKLMDALDAALPVIMEKGGDLAWEAAKSFLSSWKDADLATKLFVGWLVLAKFNVFGTLATMGAEIFMRRWRRKMAVEAAADTAMGGVGGTLGKKFARGFGIAAVALIALEIAPAISKELQKIDPTGIMARYSGSQGWGRLWHDATDWTKGRLSPEQQQKNPFAPRSAKQRHGQMGGFPQGAFPGSVTTGPYNPLMGPALPPTRLKGVIENHVTVELDGREIGKSVKKRQADLKARR